MNYINIPHIIKNSNSKFLKRLPDFSIRIIAWIVRQEEINRILKKYEGFEGVDFLPKIIEELEITVECEGLENLPENGKCFFVANHPFGLLDGLILTNIVGSKYGNLKAIGNDAFMFVPNLRPIVSNVNVFGKNPRKYFIELSKVFASDVPITHFPYGLVSRIYKLKIQDKFWHKSFITKAIQHKRNIIPVRFYGRNSYLFYSIFLLRQVVKIKINLELILLPHELFRKRGKTIKVTIGEMIQYSDLDASMSHWDWAQKIRNEVYSHKNN